MRLRRVRASLVLPLIAIALWETGCLASKITVSDPGREAHKVKVGGEVVVVLPASLQTREWRLTAYDEQLLTNTMDLRLVSTGTGSEWVARFEARKPGLADVEFTRVSVGRDPDAKLGERRRYRIDIRK